MSVAAQGLAARVLLWQRQHGRQGLPWQGTRDPYRVWLSEVMLQQTQVATVLGYYARFVQRFATVHDLAAASLDEVLALWSGLGYYSRAHNLHRCAQAVVAQHGGEFPCNSAALAGLPGIGRSTAAAIAAFCFGERVAILDGNVKRVLSRVLGFEGDLSRAAELRSLWQQADALLPSSGIEAYTQGLMDLGATVCTTRQPACQACPLAGECVAHAAGQTRRYPVKGRQLQRGRREHALLWLQQGSKLWLARRPDSGVWSGLWSLPEFGSLSALQARLADWPGQGHVLPTVEHALTHFDWTLRPLRWQLPARCNTPTLQDLLPDGGGQGRWLTAPQALALGLPAPVRRLLEEHGD